MNTWKKRLTCVFHAKDVKEIVLST
jgi:hypothetical protein